MTANQKLNEIVTQLNVALLQKEQLTEQLEQASARVKALRNLLTGVDLGRKAATEQFEAAKAVLPQAEVEHIVLETPTTEPA